MIVRTPDQRVAVLVDVQNLYYSAKNLYNARVNFKNLLEITVQNRKLIRAIAYVIGAEKTNEQDFFDAINNVGFEVKEKPLQTFYGGAKKGDWDLGIAMDAIRLGNKVDSIVLVSGDGDFRPVVNYLQHASGCLVEVCAFNRTANSELIAMADDYIDIEEHTDELLFKMKPRPVVTGSRNPESGNRK
ncbi:MAG: NYN domain-containing protein [bacterium]